MVYQSDDVEGDAKVSKPGFRMLSDKELGNTVPENEAEPVEAKKMVSIDDPTSEEIESIVETIVKKWNIVVKQFENTTIRLCLMVNEILRNYPDNTVKEVLKKVRQHPDVKKFVSIDRIWQGMRLIKSRPDLIEYYQKDPKEKENVPENDKPYIKKDGEVFWEFYFELAKQPLSNGTLLMLEQEGKKDKWSFRELRQKISEAKIEMAEPMGYETKRQEKYELIRQISAICKELKVEQLRGVLNLCKEFQKENKDGASN